MVIFLAGYQIETGRKSQKGYCILDKKPQRFIICARCQKNEYKKKKKEKVYNQELVEIRILEQIQKHHICKEEDVESQNNRRAFLYDYAVSHHQQIIDDEQKVQYAKRPSHSISPYFSV